MKLSLYKTLAWLVALALALSACSGAATPDASAIATSAVQTVEARYTQQAALTPQDPPETSTPTEEVATATAEVQATALPTMAPQTPQSNGKPCYAASVQDITIVDGSIELPGSTFTKTWRLFNNGNCPWDSSYALVFDSGDAMGAVTKVPLTTKVYPGASIDISVELTAPATNGMYTGYWRMATPYGGTFGVGQYDQSIFVKINVSSKPEDAFAVSSVTYDWTRDPQKGCDKNGGMRYTVYATITVNEAGMVYYHWDRSPYDGGPLDGGKLKFTAAGSAVVNWTWTLSHDSVHGIDRWISLSITDPAASHVDWGRVKFPFDC